MSAPPRGRRVGVSTLDRGAHEGLVRPPGQAARPARRRPGPTLAVVTAVGAVVGSWWFTLTQETTSLPSPAVIGERGARFLSELVGIGVEGPTAYEQASQWLLMAELARDTVVMSALAVGLAGAVTVATVGFASRLLTVGELAPARRGTGRALFTATRGVHVVARAIPELIWAMLIVIVLSPGLVAGALALAVHEIGVLGRLSSDVVDNVDHGPLRALRSSGAGTLQAYGYGVLPQVLPQLVTFLLYRWEVVLRATVVVGFVTGAGLGEQLESFRVRLDWDGLGLVLVTYVLLVLAGEAVAAGLRRLAR